MHKPIPFWLLRKQTVTVNKISASYSVSGAGRQEPPPESNGFKSGCRPDLHNFLPYWNSNARAMRMQSFQTKRILNNFKPLNNFALRVVFTIGHYKCWTTVPKWNI
jgi:hypothetical protein